MFEQSMVSSLVKEMEYICGQNNAEKILEATVSLGSLSGIEEDTLKYWFETVSEGTLAEGCTINIQKAEVEVFCNKCQCHSKPPYPLLTCMSCHNTDVELLEGHMINIENLALI